MGWKGTVRSLLAINRSMALASQRRQNELNRQNKKREKLNELEKHKNEVSKHIQNIQDILSIHKSFSPPFDWSKFKEPIKPEDKFLFEIKVKNKISSYTPNFVDRLFNLKERRLKQLNLDLENAQKKDFLINQQALEKYNNSIEKFNIAEGILKKDPNFFIPAIEKFNPFKKIRWLGSSITFKVIDKNSIEANLVLHKDTIIPITEKSLLQSGKISTRKITTAKFFERYKDHVCSSILRLSTEIFNFLPTDNLLINAYTDILNRQTGQIENNIIISIFIPKITHMKLNLNLVDPSESLKNFKHNMDFKKLIGFSKVDKVLLDN